MSLDHEDIERIETIEERMNTVEKTYRQFTEDMNGLSYQLEDIRKRQLTIEETIKELVEVRKEKIGEIETQMNSMIDQLPIGVRGMMKKLVKKEDKESDKDE